MLKLDGKPFSSAIVSPAVQKVKDFLNKCPVDEIFSRPEMITRGFSKDTLDRMTNLFPETSRLWHSKRYYGSPKALAAFDKEVGK